MTAYFIPVFSSKIIKVRTTALIFVYLYTKIKHTISRISLTFSPKKIANVYVTLPKGNTYAKYTGVKVIIELSEANQIAPASYSKIIFWNW